MAEVLLFHHAQGLTEGVRAFAYELRGAGHTVHTPDVYDGRTFPTLDEGLDYARKVGFGALLERGVRSADDLPGELIYAGFSLGVMAAQQLTQTRPGARGALFFHSCLPVAEFGTWPSGVAVQIHSMEEDPFFVGEDSDAAHELVASVEEAELFLYPGGEHLFADNSLPSFRAEPAAILTQRALDFLSAR